MGHYFGTDGIRGRYGEAPMTDLIAHRLALALSSKLEASATVVIGRDTRASGQTLQNIMRTGFEARGHKVILLGVVPTPAVAMAVTHFKATMGIALTASHNPASDNGIKLFNERGQKLKPEEEQVIESLLEAELSSPTNFKTIAHSPEKIVFETQAQDEVDFYIKKLSEQMPKGSLSGIKVVLDSANGATYLTSPAVLSYFGAELMLIGNEPDGSNINQGLGSESPEALAKTVLETGADIGIAHDGDGDRLVVCDERGTIVDGDQLLGIYALEALKSDSLKAKTLVVTVQSNLALDFAVKAAGGSVKRVDVGDRNVALAMRELGSNIGGESSGHILFTDDAPTGDGLLAAIQLLKILQASGEPLSKLSHPIQRFPQKTQNLIVKEKIPLEALPKLSEAKAEVEEKLGEEGRVLMRYSGTEPKLRLLVEAKTQAEVEASMQIILTAAHHSLPIV